MELLGATRLDLGQAGDELVAPPLELAEGLESRDARGGGEDVGLQAPSGTGQEVVGDGDRELLLQPRDLAAQRAASGVLVLL
ncbi:hypothetical protein [Patulibacter sp.]|uniref:hypothetical protein n=1 Tax=Patulibacter sp. TaxID=1912859 RepID=UPI00271807A6|nr:hypothetical protein [Patulibacter sp.]MDO9409568.1 hypothetical protein [Patulibacter sp.]